MSNTTIIVEDLSKKFRLIDPSATSVSSLKDVLLSPLRRYRQIHSLTHFGRNDDNVLWALQNISFEVDRGDVFGIIGHNGAGKSTLLKILSQITPPTSGKIILNGRVNSLLEVGTGFLPELSGRDNIYMNGTIHGMSKSEIDMKFDDIVEFAGVQKFIDIPIKRYSSGMGVRLGFAVAAFLEPEILIIDEVLSVGDVEFQNKCIGKMEEVTTELGRTVLIVSHNLNTINSLCNKCMLLKNGAVKTIGKTQMVLEEYINEGKTILPFIEFENATNLNRSGEKYFSEIKSFEMVDVQNQHKSVFEMGSNLKFRMKVAIKEKVREPEFGVAIITLTGARLHHLVSNWEMPKTNEYVAGTYEVEISVPKIKLYPGEYSLIIWTRVAQGTPIDDYIEGFMNFSIIKSGDYLTNISFNNFSKSGGVYQKSIWEVKPLY